MAKSDDVDLLSEIRSIDLAIFAAIEAGRTTSLALTVIEWLPVSQVLNINNSNFTTTL